MLCSYCRYSKPLIYKELPVSVQASLRLTAEAQAIIEENPVLQLFKNVRNIKGLE